MLKVVQNRHLVGKNCKLHDLCYRSMHKAMQKHRILQTVQLHSKGLWIPNNDILITKSAGQISVLPLTRVESN